MLPLSECGEIHAADYLGCDRIHRSIHIEGTAHRDPERRISRAVAYVDRCVQIHSHVHRHAGYVSGRVGHFLVEAVSGLCAVKTTQHGSCAKYGESK